MSNERRMMLLGERAELIDKARDMKSQFETAATALNIVTISSLAEIDANQVKVNAMSIESIKIRYDAAVKRIREITDEVDGRDAPTPII